MKETEEEYNTLIYEKCKRKTWHLLLPVIDVETNRQVDLLAPKIRYFSQINVWKKVFLASDDFFQKETRKGVL